MAQTDRIAGYVGDIALKLPCRVATTGAITLSGLQTIDGVAVAAGDRVLVKNQVSAVENGIYFAATGSWPRTPDFDGARDAVKGTTVSVTDGTTLSGYWFEVSSENTNQPGVDALTFAETASGPTAALAAANSAAAALVSEGAAAGSASNAATSETNAATSASNAATSETNAATSASNAATSETNAATSAANLPNAPTAGADKYIKSNATADGWVYKTPAEVTAELTAGIIGLTAGKAQQVDQAVTATTRAATTTLGTTLYHTLSDTSTTITAFNGVAGVTYHCTALGAGEITYHATNLIIKQGLASINTAAGDTFEVYMLTATTCEVRNYQRATAVSFSVHKNGTNQSIPNATYTKVTFSTEEFDIGGYFDTTNSRFTPPAGYYNFNASATLASSADTKATILALYKNGVSYKLGPYNRSPTIAPIGAGINCLAAANGTDYFELYIFQESGTQNLSGAATNSYFMGHRVGDL